MEAFERDNLKLVNKNSLQKYTGGRAKSSMINLDEMNTIQSNEQIQSIASDNNYSETAKLDGKHELNCNFCQMPFSSERWLKKHVESIHLLKSKQKCAICDFSTFDMFNLYEHNSTVHINIKYDCDECEAKFTNERYL